MTRGLIVVAGVAWVSLAPAAAPQVSSSPARVRVYVGVQDKLGAPVPGITREEFEVLVNGLPRAIDGFSSEAGPLTSAVLVDIPSSTMAADADSEVDDFLEAVTALRPIDRMRMGRVSKEPVLLPAPTNNRGELRKQMRQLFRVEDEERRGPSPIWDAAGEAVAAMEGESGHRAVVLITDGRASGNRLSLRDVAVRALSAGISINVVAVGAGRVTMRQSDTTAVNVSPGVLLEWIAETTGGLYVAMQRTPQVRAVIMADRGRELNRVLTMLHQMYVLDLAVAEPDPQTPTIEVRVKRPDVAVRAPQAFLNPLRRPGLSPHVGRGFPPHVGRGFSPGVSRRLR